MTNTNQSSNNLLGVQYSARFKSNIFERDLAKAIFEKYNVDSKYLPQVAKKSDFKKAINDYHKEHKSKGSILSNVTEIHNQITFQINACELNKLELIDANTGDLIQTSKKIYDANTIITVVYDCLSDRVINDDSIIVQRIETLLQIRRSTYTKQVIKDALMRYLIDNAAAYKIASDMDLLMVPGCNLHMVENCEKIARELDTNVEFTHFEIQKSVINQTQITDSIVGKMEKFNNDWQKKVEEFCNQSSKMPKSEINKFMNEIESNFKFLDSYKDILETQYDTVIKNINATKALVNQYVSTGNIVNPYQKTIDELIDVMGDNKEMAATTIKKMQELNPEYKTVDLPDDIADLISEI